VKASFDGPE